MQRVTTTVLNNVFQQADLTNRATCPNLDRGAVPGNAVCYYNYTKQNPSEPYILRDATGKQLNILDCFCVSPTVNVAVDAEASRLPNQVPAAPTYYLAPPADAAGVTNVEYLLSPSPNTTCASFPNGPADCWLEPDHYCREPSGTIEGLSCQPNAAVGSKFGGCVPDGQGGSLQGWQCVPTTWDCVPHNGTRMCQINPNNAGRYTSQQACLAAHCEDCQDKNFCNNHGVCSHNQCICTENFTGADCSCPPKGSQSGSGCKGCDWPDLATLQKCGGPCDTYCGNQGNGLECLCACSDCKGCTGPCKPNGCFRVGTQVLMQDRTTKSIETISTGDHVLSYVNSNSHIQPSEVGNEKVFQRLPLGFFWYGFNDVTPFFTANHPFLTWNGKWVALDPEGAKDENPDLLCDQMKIGQTLRRWKNGEYEPFIIRRITVDPSDGTEEMHGLYLLGEKSYHANGFCVKMNYPLFTKERLRKQWRKMTMDERKSLLEKLKSAQPEMKKWLGSSWFREMMKVAEEQV